MSRDVKLGRAVLGKTGIEVSRLCLGALTMSPLQCDMPPERGAELILYAYERGVDFVDTAEYYRNYAHIKPALAREPSIKVAAKAYCYDRKTAAESFENAMRGLGRDYIDIFELHEQEDIHTLRGHREALDYLNEQKVKGRIGAVGVSTHHVECVHAAVYFGGIDVIFPLINIAGLGIQGGTREDMEREIVRAADAGIGLYAMKALGGGNLLSRREEAIAYALSLPGISSVAVGMQSEDEIDCNVALFNGLKPAQDVVRRIAKSERRLLIDDWCEGCGRCVKRCGQGALSLVNGKSHVDKSKCVLCGYCAGVCPEFCIKVC